MKKLMVTLRSIEPITGFGEEITGMTIAIELERPYNLLESSDLLVNVSLLIQNHPQEIKIAQKKNSSEIIEQDGKTLLPLDGTLWLLGRPEEQIILNSEITIYYQVS